MPKISLSLDDKTHEALIEYSSSHGMKVSKAACVLINIALDKKAQEATAQVSATEPIIKRLDELEKTLQCSMDELTERMAKTTL